MKKFLITGLLVFGIAIIALVDPFDGVKNRKKDYDNEKDIETNVNETPNKRIYLNIISSIDFSVNVTSLDYLENKSSDIIIGKIKSIDGATNYNEKSNDYMFVATYGTIEVDGIIKSDSNISINDTIQFIRMGGEITVAEYEKSLEPRQITRQKIDQLSDEEKQNSYVRMYVANDIEVEIGKTYLMYLSYDGDVNKYSIIGFENGLREYKELDNTVKNNSNGNFEQLTYKIVR